MDSNSSNVSSSTPHKAGKIVLNYIDFNWEIRAWNYHKQVGIYNYIYSPIFYNSWSLKLYPNGDNETNENHLVIYLYNEQNYDLKATYSISVCNGVNGEVLDSFTNTERFGSKDSEANGWGFKGEHKQVIDEVVGDELVIKCQVRID